MAACCSRFAVSCFCSCLEWRHFTVVKMAERRHGAHCSLPKILCELVAISLVIKKNWHLMIKKMIKVCLSDWFRIWYKGLLIMAAPSQPQMTKIAIKDVFYELLIVCLLHSVKKKIFKSSFMWVFLPLSERKGHLSLMSTVKECWFEFQLRVLTVT